MNHPNDNKRPNSHSGSLGKFYRSRERLIHTSAPIGYRPNPHFNKCLPAGPMNPVDVPFVVELGKDGTLNLGRNAEKRAKRAKRARIWGAA